MTLRSSVSLLVFILWGILPSCAIEPADHQLNLVFTGDPKSTDPAHATDVRTGQLCALLYDTLVGFGYGTELIPLLAESWDIVDAGREYHFHLRQDVHFTDGTLLTATLVCKSLERLLHPNTHSHRTWLLNRVVGAEEFMSGSADSVSGIRAADDSTLVIRLIQPFAPFLGFMAMPAAAVVKISDSGELLGTGPWLVEEWVHDGHLLLQKNQHYFGDGPALDQLRIRILPEALPRTAEFVTGYLDIMELPAAEYPLWLDDPEWRDHIHHQDELNTYYIGLNCSRPPFDDVRVRQALNHAVDIDHILQTIHHGRGIRAAGPIPPQLLPGDPLKPYSYDPDLARDLLTQAGYVDGLEVELWQSQSPELLLITEAIQSQLAAVGVEVKLIRNDWNMFSQAITQGRPDMYYRSWWADYPDPENFLAPLFESQASLTRWTRYVSTPLDSLIAALQGETDESYRQQLARRANAILHQDAPWIYLWHSQSAMIVNPNLQGWKPHLMFNAQKYNRVTKRNGP